MDYGARFSATIEKGVRRFRRHRARARHHALPVLEGDQRPRRAQSARARHLRHAQHASPIWIEDLIALVEDCASSELYSLLKRPDEKAVTERAYENPVFVEDLVRNVAARANREPRTSPGIAWRRRTSRASTITRLMR